MFTIINRWFHSKASEEFVEVEFNYPGLGKLNWSVPIKYPRAGLDLDDEDAIQAHVSAVFEAAHPTNREQWRKDQAEYWGKSSAPVTKPIFDIMARDFAWLSYSDMSGSSNPARRIQDLKEMGYTIATRRLKGRGYEFMLLPVPRHGESGYEWWSGALRSKIVRILGGIDAYEGRPGNSKALLPDHKFPEARWDEATRRDTLEHLTEAEISRDFQLVTNQRNQQKREVCRRCLQTGQRGYPFGIPYYYVGSVVWPAGVPKRGKAAEAGCLGCGWYDLQAWRSSIIDACGASSPDA